MLQTTHTAEVVSCSCGSVFRRTLIRVIDISTDVELLNSLLAGRLNLVRCDFCGREFGARRPVYVHDPVRRRYVCFYPGQSSAAVPELQVAFLRELLDEWSSVPLHVREAEHVFDAAELARALGVPQPVDPFDEEVSLPSVHELREDDFEEVIDSAAFDRHHSALIQRWRESGQHHYAFIENGVATLFELTDEPDAFGGETDLFLQLFRSERFPLINLVLVAAGRPNRVLSWLFHIDNPVDVKFLEALAHRFEIRLHLFSSGFTHGRSLHVALPLERSAAYVLAEARRWHARIDPGRRNFFAAVAMLDENVLDRLGRRAPAPLTDGFHALPTPALTKLALDILSCWSNPAEAEHLVFIKAFPLARFRRILRDVLSQALHFGLALEPEMAALCLGFGLVRSASELAALQLERFATSVRAASRFDLDHATAVENWRRLFDSAARAHIEVSEEHRALAAEADARLREDAIPLDLSDDLEKIDLDPHDNSEWIGLLGDREQRVEAIRALAVLGSPESIDLVREAYQKLTAAEVERLGDALADFGLPIRSVLVDLAGGRGAQARGALRALHRLDPPSAVDRLVQLLAEGRGADVRLAQDLLRDPRTPIEPMQKALARLEGLPQERLCRILARRPEPEARAAARTTRALRRGRSGETLSS